MANKQAHTLAAILEQCVVTAFDTRSDGRMFVQILFPDGSGLTAAMDDAGNPQVRYLAEEYGDENELDPNIGVDGVIVEAGRAP